MQQYLKIYMKSGKVFNLDKRCTKVDVIDGGIAHALTEEGESLMLIPVSNIEYIEVITPSTNTKQNNIKYFYTYLDYPLTPAHDDAIRADGFITSIKNTTNSWYLRHTFEGDVFTVSNMTEDLYNFIFCMYEDFGLVDGTFYNKMVCKIKKEVQYMKKHYGLGSLIFDFIMTIVTGGLWLIWIVIRFLRANS